jgi:hypothetical protein
MRTAFLGIVMAGSLFAAEPEPLGFADAVVGKLPKGWSSAKTGKGEGSVWKIVADDSTPNGKALAQVSADGSRPLFNLCVANDTHYADLDLTVSVKAIAGKIDQGGGPVWRYQDADNYYIARINPLENNYRVYKVVDGQRTQLATADVTTPAKKWHVLRIVQKGNQIRCYANNTLYLEVKDDTFKQAGKIGLWTKADAQTYFAELRVSGK